MKAVEDGTIVGTVQGRLDQHGSCRVGRLAVDPLHQGKGIGRALMESLEQELPQVQRFELFTGHLSERTLRFYRTLGYQETHRERENGSVTLVWLEERRDG